MKEQIEELEVDLLQNMIRSTDNGEIRLGDTARNLYEKGWRKQSEVAREIFSEIEREFCGAYWYKGYTIERYIAELKKKYTEDQT